MKEGMVWWGAERGGHLWADGGRVVLPAAQTQEQAEALFARFEAGEFFCAGCKEWHPKPYAFRRWAGLFCSDAADAYKAANSRACRICGRPIWDCSC